MAVTLQQQSCNLYLDPELSGFQITCIESFRCARAQAYQETKTQKCSTSKEQAVSTDPASVMCHAGSHIFTSDHTDQYLNESTGDSADEG